MPDNHYDVIIIGGRCAGSSLALRLAGSDLRILLVDRATFPSSPNVPSAPFIHPGTMSLLDELGLAESEYTIPGSKIERFVIHYVGYFEAEMPMSNMGLDRNYFYGIDRRHFDSALWRDAAQASGVTTQDGFGVTQVLKDQNGAVTGIAGPSQSFTADLVVGADGRFSFAAREFGAKVVEEQNKFTTAVYLAEWENVDDYSADWPHAVTNYNTGKRFMVLVIPIGERRYLIGSYMPSPDSHFGGQGVEQAYAEGLQRVPHLWNRLKNARRVTDVVGIRPIENGYREAYGPNWALVGDAVHYKDPSDGQGVYDALMGSKLLAQAVLDWKRRGISWEQAGAAYQQRLMEKTHPMFRQTVANVKQTIFMQPPGFIIRTLIRYGISSPDFQNQFLRYLSRAIDPADFQGAAMFPRILMQGIATDIRQRFKGSSAWH